MWNFLQAAARAWLLNEIFVWLLNFQEITFTKTFQIGLYNYYRNFTQPSTLWHCIWRLEEAVKMFLFSIDNSTLELTVILQANYQTFVYHQNHDKQTSFTTHTLIYFYFFSSSMSKSREQLEEQGMGAHFHWVSPLNQNMARTWRSLTVIKNSLMINFSSKAWCGYLLTSVGWLHSRLMELSIPAITTLLLCCLAMHRKSWKER